MVVREVYCFAVGRPEPRAECTVGKFDIVATSPQALAQALLELGAPDGLTMVFRLRGVVDGEGIVQTGYSRGSVNDFAIDRDIYVEDEPKWTERFGWMCRFGK